MSAMTARTAPQRGHSRPEFGNEVISTRATDPVAYSQCATGWSHTYEQLTAGAFTVVLRGITLGPIQVAYERLGCAFRYTGQSWPGARLFGSTVDAESRSYFDGRPIGGDAVLSYRWDAVKRVHSPGPTRYATVAIDEAYLLQRIHCVLGSAAPETLPAIETVTDSRRTLPLMRLVMDVVDEVDRRPQFIEDARACAEFQGRIVDALVMLTEPAEDHRRRLPSPTTRSYIVRKAAEIMEARIADAISVSDLCEAIRVCPRTLRYSFEEVTGVSPMQYLLSMRLNGVRRDLCGADLDTPVQIVATRWGFWHLSRFARYYRLAFGERPSDTAARAAASRRQSTRAD